MGAQSIRSSVWHVIGCAVYDGSMDGDVDIARLWVGVHAERTMRSCGSSLIFSYRFYLRIGCTESGMQGEFNQENPISVLDFAAV